MLMWLNRLERQFREAGGVSWISKRQVVGADTNAARLRDLSVTFYCACIASAALTHILEPAYRVCWLCLSCEGREAYKSYMDDCERGKYDEESAGWCQSESMLLEKLSFVESRLQAVYDQVVRQPVMEQKAFIKLVDEDDIEAKHIESGTFQLCRPCKKGLQWFLPIVWGVDRLWSSLTTFSQQWEELMVNHNVELKLNPSGCSALAPARSG